MAVAVTGGIGAGKSEALAAFERHGAAVVSSDDIVHHLLRADPEVKRAIIEHFGEDVLGPDGEIDRKAVANRVFTSRAELEWLETLLHPRVSQVYLRWREELAKIPEPPAVCVTEVPLLYETGAEDRFDVVVAITASPEVRLARSIVPDVMRREERLVSEEEKVRRADFAYVNNGTLEELDGFVAEVMGTLTA